MKTANPYLKFNGNTEEAFEFYGSVFDVDVLDVVRFGDLDGNPMRVPEEGLEKIAHISLPIGDSHLMGTDSLESMDDAVSIGDNFLIALEPDSNEEADRLFAGLSEGGEVQLPLQETEWAEKHGICVDRFGVQWMIDYTGDVQPSG